VKTDVSQLAINWVALDGVHDSAENVPFLFWFLIDFVKDVRATMMYMHVLNKGGHGVRSPTDDL